MNENQENRPFYNFATGIDGQAHVGQAITLGKVGQVHVHLRETSFPNPKTSITAPVIRFPHLPARPQCFGRRHEGNRLTKLLSAGCLPAAVCILGGGGIGKSNLCLWALTAPEVLQRFAARRLFVRCDAVFSCDALVAELARSLGINPGPYLEERVFSVLEEAPTALALDNLETPWERKGETLLVEDFLARLAGLPTLFLTATVRGQEQPAGVPWMDPISLTRLDTESATRIFLAVAGRKFAKDRHLPSILISADGLPLAVELLARQARTEQSLDVLDRRRRVMRTGLFERHGEKTRISSLAVSIELSMTSPRMTPLGKRLASLLGILPNGIARDDLSNLFSYPAEGECAGAVLLQVGLATEVKGRLQVPAPVREYLANYFPPDAATLARVVEYYTAMSFQLGNKVGSAQGAKAIAKLSEEIENITEITYRALDCGEIEMGIESALGFGEFHRFVGFGTVDLLLRAKEAAEKVENRLYQAVCIQSLGDIALRRSEHDCARKLYLKAEGLFDRIEHILGKADCIRGLGEIALEQTNHREARACFEKAMSLYEHLGSRRGRAVCIQGLGDMALACSDYETAKSRYQDALSLFKAAGFARGEADCFLRLGDLGLRRSEHESAHRHLSRALELYEQVGDILGRGYCIQGLGDLALVQSNFDAAERCFSEALTLFDQVGSVFGRAGYIQRLGDLALARNNPAEAKSRFEEALALFEKAGDKLGRAECVTRLGSSAVDAEQFEAARELFLEALQYYETICEPCSTGWIRYHLARISQPEVERIQHVQAARTAWTSIRRLDLVAKLDREFPLGSD